MPGAPKKAAKGRLDKYYYLAKEQGLRSRAAFKLVQLEKKYQFLDKATGVLDLCAAPGGWMQIARKTAKPGTPILGIDLDAIKPIPGCVGIVGDITTQKARADIKAELKGKPCNVVLHDGAPNVGLNWTQDAFTQNELVLHSLKLAIDVLSKGGVFVTKIFRSKDYNSLLWIFKQLFSKVEATKPPASRDTSAEIFVVCRDYLAPKKIDPKLLDFRYVFKEFEDKSKLPSVFSKDHSKKAPREGYDTESNPTLYQRVSAFDFVKSNDAVRLLGEFNEIEFRDDKSKEIFGFKCTTDEIKALCADLRVCSKGDYRNILRWKDRVNTMLEELYPKKKKELDDEDDDDEEERDEKEIEIEEMEELEGTLTTAEKKERREKRKKLERRRKLQAKIDLKMVLPGDEVEQEEIDLFALNKIKTDMLDEIAETEVPDFDIADEIRQKKEEKERLAIDAYLERSVNEAINDNTTESRINRMEEELDIWYASAEAKKANPRIIDRRGKKIKNMSDPELDMTLLDSYKKMKEERTQTSNYVPNVSGEVMVEADEEYPMREESEGEEDLSGRESEGEYEEDEEEGDYDDPEFVEQKFKEANKAKNKLLVGEDDGSVDLLTKRSIAWYSQDMFQGLDEENEEEELEKLERSNKQNKNKNKNKNKKRKSRDDDSDEEELIVGQMNRKEEAAKTRAKESRKKGKTEDDEGFEEVPIGFESKLEEEEDYGSDIDPEDQEKAMMLATMLKRDKKLKDELVDGLYNRFAWDDNADDLPMWFQHEEKPHNTPALPITKEIAQEIKDKLKELHARPIKKVAEARARKKMRATRKMEKAKAKAEVIASNADMSNADKSRAIEQLYRKNMKDLNKKKNFNYIVASKGRGATGQPVGKGKGPNRVVDTRLKKDKRAQKKLASKKRK
eukprot:TRINITY_DN4017_c0_g1_i1.p1 TRINITY_DN4017_c0_g1~~TRINITY_DN4017_c0_g1_i1.p1  ORF type:complete len:904 (+),score=360.07 TRINITY_DN4017_c0_g1_i1:113-2824(+)